MSEAIRDLQQRKERSRQGGSPESIEKQHRAKKLTARERIDLLFDPGTFTEHDLLVKAHSTDFGLEEAEIPGAACITGCGKIGGRNVWVYADDFTIHGGTWGEMSLKKLHKTMDRALHMGAPLVLLNDSGGMRPQEQHAIYDYDEGYFLKHVWMSGVIPQISLIMGPVAGGPCYGPALTDFIFMVKGSSYMFIAGPPVVKSLIGEDVTAEKLGGAGTHARISGVADLALENDAQCLQRCRELLTFLPSSNLEEPPVVNTGDDPHREDAELNSILPLETTTPYDMHGVITRIVDKGYFFELKPDFARNLITGFARLNGRTAGILASQPAVMGGALDIDSADKGCRFIRFCDAFNIPIVNLMDTPAFLVGTRMEYGGIIRHGAKILYAQAETTVPKVTVVLRKAFAGALIGMGARFVGADITLAWPTAQFGIFGVDAGMSILLRSSAMKEKLAASKNPEKLMAQWKKEYHDKYLDLYQVGPHTHVDDIIEPRETRPALIKALDSLTGKKKELPWKKHGNMPV